MISPRCAVNEPANGHAGRDHRASVLLISILAGALLIRLGIVGALWLQSGGALAFPDEQLHWGIASSCAEHKLMISSDGRYASRMPGYPLMLWPFAELGDHGILATRIMQCVLGAVTAMVAAWWALVAVGWHAGWIAGVLVALDPFNAYSCHLLLTEVPFTFVLVLASAMSWRYLHSAMPLLGDAILAALLAGFAVMLRPAALAWIAALALIMPLMVRPRSRGLQLGLLAVAATISMLLPWGARNYAVLGHFAWLSTNGGWTLYDGQGPAADGSSQQAEFRAQVPELERLREVEQDALLRERAIEQMKRDPSRVLRLAWTKLLRTWNLIPNYAEYRRPALAWMSALYTGVILLGALGSLWFVRRDVLLHFLLWLPVVVTTLIHMVYVGSVRYRVPLMPFLAIAAAVFAVRLIERRRAVRDGCL